MEYEYACDCCKRPMSKTIQLTLVESQHRTRLYFSTRLPVRIVYLPKQVDQNAYNIFESEKSLISLLLFNINVVIQRVLVASFFFLSSFELFRSFPFNVKYYLRNIFVQTIYKFCVSFSTYKINSWYVIISNQITIFLRHFFINLGFFLLKFKMQFLCDECFSS